MNDFSDDKEFQHNLKACQEWPKHAYMFRPHGLKDALFLLHGIAEGKPLPALAALRKACALVYVDHLRLEGHYYCAEEAKQKKAQKWNEEIREAMKKRAEEQGKKVKQSA